MNIYLVLNTEYMDEESRGLWYAKSLNACLSSDSIIITHEIFSKDPITILNQIPDRLYSQFDIDKVSEEQLRSIPQIYIPDELLFQPEFETRSSALFYLFSKRNLELETFLKSKIQTLKKNGKPIEIAFHALEPFKSIRFAFESENIPLVSYVFSSIRKVHGYRDNLYMASFSSIFNSAECATRFNSIKDEIATYVKFQHNEILSFFCSKENLHLIPYINKIEKYEISVYFEGYEVVPQVFDIQRYNTDDILYEINKCFNSDLVLTRLHPYRLKKYQLEFNLTSDPTSSILSSKRITAVSSQILLIGLLWNKVVVNKFENLPFGFVCEKSLQSNNKHSISFLNFYLFSFLIPDKLMFSSEYWKWRSLNPSENEILMKHLSYYVENSSLTFDIFNKKTANPVIENILSDRGCSNYDIESITENIFYNPPVNLNHFLTAIAIGDAKEKIFRRAEQLKTNYYKALFNFYSCDFDFFSFFPFLDSTGFIRLNKIDIYCSDGLKNPVIPSKFVFVNSSGIKLPFANKYNGIFTIVLEWEFISVEDFLNSGGNAYD